MKIITISGAGCTGKTTLLDTIKQKRGTDNIQYYGEFIRTIFYDKYASKYKDFASLLAGDPEDIIDIQVETAELFNKILLESDDAEGVMIFDRSPIDISIYMYLNLAERITTSKELEYYLSSIRYLATCRELFMTYSPYILYARPFSGDVVEDDGFRPESLIKQRELEISLFDHEFLSLPEAIVLPDSLEERVALVESLIDR